MNLQNSGFAIDAAPVRVTLSNIDFYWASGRLYRVVNGQTVPTTLQSDYDIFGRYWDSRNPIGTAQPDGSVSYAALPSITQPASISPTIYLAIGGLILLLAVSRA